MVSPETLRFSPLFVRQDAGMLAKIAMLAEEKEVEAGYQLFFEGEVARSLYLILGGSVALTMNVGEKGDQRVERLEPIGKGQVAGWSSIVKPHIYKLGAYADEASHLIKFDADGLRALLDENPSYGYYFMQKLAEVIGERLLSKCVQIMSMIDFD
jgi:CRP/FNR family cyclic AMP-dependent transcriptional regulator